MCLFFCKVEPLEEFFVDRYKDQPDFEKRGSSI